MYRSFGPEWLPLILGLGPATVSWIWHVLDRAGCPEPDFNLQTGALGMFMQRCLGGRGVLDFLVNIFLAEFPKCICDLWRRYTDKGAYPWQV